jgi:signal transduction histidine kinase
MADFAIIIALTLGSCLVVGLIGAALLHWSRGRSLRYQLLIATLLPVAAVTATVLLNVRFMFLSEHDSTVVLLALGVAVALALVAAWAVMRRVARGSAELGAGLKQLVADTAEADDQEARPGSDETRELPQELSAVLAELSRTRHTLAEARAAQRAAEESRRELVSFMSHDLRTPLAGLRAISEALEDGVISDVPRAIGHLRATVARMSHLVDDLFELSRVQGTTTPKPASLVSVSELIGDVGTEIAAAARARRVQLDIDVPEDDRLSVWGSGDDLARAMTNLVANAVRHTRPDQHVRLIADRAADGHIRVAVIDRCGGIPAAHLTRVFDAGWRGTPSRSGDDGGSGLGLAIAKGVVQSHEGSIAVRNVTGGCRFDLVLPRPEPQGAAG